MEVRDVGRRVGMGGRQARPCGLAVGCGLPCRGQGLFDVATAPACKDGLARCVGQWEVGSWRWRAECRPCCWPLTSRGTALTACKTRKTRENMLVYNAFLMWNEQRSEVSLCDLYVFWRAPEFTISGDYPAQKHWLLAACRSTAMLNYHPTTRHV